MNHQSAIGEQALEFFRKLYGVERDARDMTPDERRRSRKEHAEPVAKKFKDWLEAQRSRVPDGSATFAWADLRPNALRLQPRDDNVLFRALLRYEVRRGQNC